MTGVSAFFKLFSCLFSWVSLVGSIMIDDSFELQPQDDIWKPDISLRNTYKTFTGLGSSFLNARIAYNGDVEWKPLQVGFLFFFCLICLIVSFCVYSHSTECSNNYTWQVSQTGCLFIEVGLQIFMYRKCNYSKANIKPRG